MAGRVVGSSEMRQAREAIEARWKCDSSLTACRGYVFNLAYVDGVAGDAAGPVDAIIMGMNPGEDPSREDGVSPLSAGNWERLCQYFSDAVGGRWATSEMFFWSSHDLGALKTRVGDFSQYLEFCADLNLRMIDFHRPKLVYQPGFGWGADAVKYYGLRHVRSVELARKPGRLLEHYEMPDGTPWLNTAHWTGAFGFSNADRDDIKAYAAALVSG
jgi:hypothetical protein